MSMNFWLRLFIKKVILHVRLCHDESKDGGTLKNIFYKILFEGPNIICFHTSIWSHGHITINIIILNFHHHIHISNIVKIIAIIIIIIIKNTFLHDLINPFWYEYWTDYRTVFLYIIIVQQVSHFHSKLMDLCW